MRLALAAALLVACVVSACSSDPAEEVMDNNLEGVILAIDAASIDDITSFTLKDGEDTYEIFIADDVEYGFPLGHLHEHVQSAGPVAVEVEERSDGKLYALSIEDV